ncbi:MAG: hypothetical protein ACOYNL_09380 [Rickettsiales bacterium]
MDDKLAIDLLLAYVDHSADTFRGTLDVYLDRVAVNNFGGAGLYLKAFRLNILPVHLCLLMTHRVLITLSRLRLLS